jgi:hypothetical protein
MIYCKELNLPCPLINDRVLNKIYALKLVDHNHPYTKIILDVNELNPELIQKCETVGIKPYFFVAFGLGNSGMSSVHSDVSYNNSQWVDFPVAINWELTPGNTVWNWWDTGTEPGINPQEEIEFSSRAYKFRGNKDPSGFELLHTYNVPFNRAVLYRSDIAHQITYNSTEKYRKCISVRFSLNDVPSWERALEIFQPFFNE